MTTPPPGGGGDADAKPARAANSALEAARAIGPGQRGFVYDNHLWQAPKGRAGGLSELGVTPIMTALSEGIPVYQHLRPRAMFYSPFNLHDRVHIDGSFDIIATVTGVCWKSDGQMNVEVGWLHNGDSKVAWFNAERLMVAQLP